MSCIQFFACPKALEMLPHVLIKITNRNLSLGQKLKTKGDFDKTFRKTVDDVLNQIFGQAATRIIYNHLEKNNSLTPEKFPKKLDAFVRSLENFLDSGALVVEGIILKHLYSSYGLEFKKIEKGRSFVDYIIQLKRTVNETRKIVSKT